LGKQTVEGNSVLSRESQGFIQTPAMLGRQTILRNILGDQVSRRDSDANTGRDRLRTRVTWGVYEALHDERLHGGVIRAGHCLHTAPHDIQLDCEQLRGVSD